MFKSQSQKTVLLEVTPGRFTRFLLRKKKWCGIQVKRDLLSFVTIARIPRWDNTLGTTLLTRECVHTSPATASLASSVVQAGTTARTATATGVDATTAAELCRCSVRTASTTCARSSEEGFGVDATKATQLSVSVVRSSPTATALSPYVIALGSTARVDGTGSDEDTTTAAVLCRCRVRTASTTCARSSEEAFGVDATKATQLGVSVVRSSPTATTLSPYVISLGSTARVDGTGSDKDTTTAAELCRCRVRTASTTCARSSEEAFGVDATKATQLGVSVVRSSPTATTLSPYVIALGSTACVDGTGSGEDTTTAAELCRCRVRTASTTCARSSKEAFGVDATKATQLGVSVVRSSPTATTLSPYVIAFGSTARVDCTGSREDTTTAAELCRCSVRTACTTCARSSEEGFGVDATKATQLGVSVVHSSPAATTLSPYVIALVSTARVDGTGSGEDTTTAAELCRCSVQTACTTCARSSEEGFWLDATKATQLGVSVVHSSPAATTLSPYVIALVSTARVDGTGSGEDTTTAAELCRCSVRTACTTCARSSEEGFWLDATKATQLGVSVVRSSPTATTLSPYVIALGSTARVDGTCSGEDTTTAAELCRCSVRTACTTCARSSEEGFGVDATKATQLGVSVVHSSPAATTLSPYVIALVSTARVDGTGSGEDTTTAAELCRCSVRTACTTCARSSEEGFWLDATKATQLGVSVVRSSPTATTLSPYVIALGSTARVDGTCSGEDTTTAAELCRCSVRTASTTCARSSEEGFGVDATKATQLGVSVIRSVNAITDRSFFSFAAFKKVVLVFLVGFWFKRKEKDLFNLTAKIYETVFEIL